MSVIENIKNTASDVAKFMARYADEASKIADALRVVIDFVPLPARQKQAVLQTVNALDKAADNIAEFLQQNPDVGTPVIVRASDVQSAVAKYLDENPAILENAIRASFNEPGAN